MSGTEPILRLAQADDLATVVRLTEEAYLPYVELLGAAPLPVGEDYAPRIAGGEVWLLQLAGEPAGLIVLETHADHMLIYSVVVAPAFQGRRLGIRLLDWAEQRALDAGLDRLRLFTNEKLVRNISLYSSYGYEEVERRFHPKRDGWTVVFMEKRL
ncbi:GNAT family N-acetyltransferase [Mesorhizobium sp. SP-1A]|jgi:GNAT superfamily N-acetyltransferase|uniref:GNAT family N-acetyltransferase n=1 Tax=Mesorhizobium sp. SP-1A TaxID=3077840 RepID=UPI0028F74CEE|nr:GNAT family N-acetyltransferase [Mesorhizobium sp. SP-1A]